MCNASGDVWEARAPLTAAARLAAVAAFVIALSTVVTAPSNAQTIRIGTFDASRSGDYNLATGTDVSGIRNAILSAFPGVTFVTSPTLTTQFLNSVDYLMIGSVMEPTELTAPLSTSEQSALTAFVDGGHGAFIAVDNSATAPGPATNQSMVSPLGLSVSGSIYSWTTVVSTTLNSPITNGPFGEVTTWQADYPGWISWMGNSTDLGNNMYNGGSDLALLNYGALGTGSGSAVISAEDIFSDADYSTATTALILNSIRFSNEAAFGVPAPPALLTTALGLAPSALLLRRRAARGRP